MATFNVEKFRFWANKVLPLVYENSLSYYEVLCKVVDKLNEVITNDNEQNQAISDLSSSVNEALALQEDEIAEWGEYIEDHLSDEALHGIVGEYVSENLEDLAIPYVTPEMYDAYGDGTHDDTSAIQQAVDSGYKVVFGCKTYLMNSTVLIAKRTTNTGSKPIYFDSSASTINYTGTTYAFEIINVWQSELKFGVLNASNGGCLFFNGTGTGIITDHNYSDITSWSSQYVNVYFSRFRCKDYNSYCVRIEQATIDGVSQWVNEIRFYNGRFNRGTGVYLKSNNTSGYTNVGSVRFINTGFEGESGTGNSLKCGVRYDSSLAKGAVQLIGVRCSECIDKLIDFSSDNNDTVMKGFILITTSAIYPELFSFTTKTYGEIIAPIETSVGQTPYTHLARVCKGQIIPSDIEIRCSSGYSNATGDFSNKSGTEIGNVIYINAAQNTISTIKLPDFYGCQNGINDVYFLFSQKQENSGDGITVLQGDNAIMHFAPITVAGEASGKVLIHCKWVNASDSALWFWWKEDINTYYHAL